MAWWLAALDTRIKVCVDLCCLTDFDGYHVTVERKNNRVIWGEMLLQPTGFELVYRSDVEDDGHMETSYVYYNSPAGEGLAPELIQGECTPQNLADALGAFFDAPERRAAIGARYGELASGLRRDTNAEAAAAVLSLLAARSG